MNGPHAPATIVLVEDDPALRELLALRLRGLGHEVRTAGCVAEAIPLVDGGRVDSVLCDHSMPGATGLDLLSYVKRRRPELPFVLMSGTLTPELAAAATSGGAAAAVDKADLLRRLRVLFPPARVALHAAA
jgi:two-component system response regulator GlrR